MMITWFKYLYLCLYQYQ